jgi:hypothetical protein
MKVEHYHEEWPDYKQRMIVLSSRARCWMKHPIALFLALNEPLHAKTITKMNADIWLGVHNVRN